MVAAGRHPCSPPGVPVATGAHPLPGSGGAGAVDASGWCSDERSTEPCLVRLSAPAPHVAGWLPSLGWGAGRAGRVVRRSPSPRRPIATAAPQCRDANVEGAATGTPEAAGLTAEAVVERLGGVRRVSCRCHAFPPCLDV
jgi:hypothetical protein